MGKNEEKQAKSTGESLINVTDICEILKISRGTWLTMEARLKAKGLKEVEIEGLKNQKPRRFLRSSLDAILVKAATEGKAL